MLEPIRRLFRLKPKVVKKIPGLNIRSKKAIYDSELIRLKDEAPTNRSGRNILKDHKIELSELIGKSVLDVGSGDSSLVDYLKQNGISAKSLDPSKIVNKVDYPIAVEELNVKDKFDVIFCHFSFLFYTKESLMRRIGFYKMLKALKTNGYISIIPTFPFDPNIRFNEEQFFRLLRNSGFNPVPDVIGGRLKIYKTSASDLNKLKKLFGLQELKD